jgi:hypothetical protein
MTKKNFEYYLKKAAESTTTSLSKCSGTASTYSFGIVNSKRNGKRLTFSKALAVIGDVTPETVEEDLNTIFDVFYYFLKGDLMNSAAGSSDIMATLGENKILSSIIDTLEANERFAPLADEITDMGMRVVASSIGKIELGSDEQYDTFVGELSTSLNSSLSMTEEERDAFVKESVQTAFVQYEMDVPEDVAITFSEKMIEDLGSDGEITDEEIHNYLDSYVVVEE